MKGILSLPWAVGKTVPLLAVLFAAVVTAVPASPPTWSPVHHHHPEHGHRTQGCAKLKLRREWCVSGPPLCETSAYWCIVWLPRRDMKPAEQRSYLGAVQCLQALPPKNATLYERFTRFDEFVIAHVQMADSIHGVVSRHQVIASRSVSSLTPRVNSSLGTDSLDTSMKQRSARSVNIEVLSRTPSTSPLYHALLMALIL